MQKAFLQCLQSFRKGSGAEGKDSWTEQEKAVVRHGDPSILYKMQFQNLYLGMQKSSTVTLKTG